MLTKSVKSVISVVLKHVARAKESVQSVRSVCNIRMVSPDSSLCQNGKQVEIITKMIFELCYIEAIVQNRFFSKSIWGGDCKLLETRCNLQSPPKKWSRFLMPILNAPPFAPYPTSSRNSMAKVVPLPTWLSYT